MVPSTTPLMLSSPLFLSQAASGQIPVVSPEVTAGTALAVSAVVLGASHYAYLKLLKNSPRRPPGSMPRGTLPLVLTSSLALHAVLLKHEELGYAAHSAYRGARILWNALNAPSVPTDPDLAAEARDALKHWKKTGSLGNLEGFILKVGTRLHRPRLPPEQAKTFVKDWNVYLSSRKSSIGPPAGPIETVEQAKAWLEDFRGLIASDFPVYRSGQWDIVKLFKTKKGNCAARMNLMLAAFIGIPLPSHLVLAVEVFGTSASNEDIGHVQPLLYDLKAGRYWNLWTGTILSKSRGDIYHAALVYHSVLVKHLQIPPVSAEDLLIVGMADPYVRSSQDKKERKKTPFADSAFAFPWSDAYYPGGSGNGGDPINDAPIEDVFTPEKVNGLRKELAAQDWEFGVLQDGQYELIVFKDRAHEAPYEALRSWKERGDYVLSLFEASLQRHTADKKFQDMLRLLEDPYARLPLASQEDLERAAQSFDGYRRLEQAAESGLSYSVRRFSKDRVNPKEEEGEVISWGAMVEQKSRNQPELKRLEAYLEAMNQSIRKDPGLFFRMLNEIKGFGGKRAAVQLTTNFELNDMLADFLADTSKIAISTSSEKAAPYRPPALKPDLFEIAWHTPEWDLPDEEKGEEKPDEEASPDPAPKSGDTVVAMVDPSAPVKISAETMIDSLLILQSSAHPELWTADLERAYRGLSNPERDRAFIDAVKSFFWAMLATEEDRNRFTPDAPARPDASTAQELAPLMAARLPKPIAMTFEDILKRRGASFLE